MVPLALPLAPMVLPWYDWQNLERHRYTIGTIGRNMNTRIDCMYTLEQSKWDDSNKFLDQQSLF